MQIKSIERIIFFSFDIGAGPHVYNSSTRTDEENESPGGGGSGLCENISTVTAVMVNVGRIGVRERGCLPKAFVLSRLPGRTEMPAGRFSVPEDTHISWLQISFGNQEQTEIIIVIA